MGGYWWTLPVVWAQAAGTGSSASSSPSPAATPNALALLALRRWCASLTLCSPESIPTFFGLGVWLAALGALLVVAAFFQGPGATLRQLLDIPGHARLAKAAWQRARGATRVIAAIIGTTVLSWTCSQALAYNRPEGRDDVVLLLKTRGLAEAGLEQGILAALTPLRDVAALGSNLPLLAMAALVVFRASTDTWSPPPVPGRRKRRASGWATIFWCAAALLILYRLVSIGTGYFELPLGGCLYVEPIVVPGLMMLCDGLLLAWLLVELRDANHDDPSAGRLEPLDSVDLVPGACWACLLAVPARYLAAAVLLATYSLPPGTAGAYLAWQLGRGLTDVQGAALLTSGLAGAVAWGGASFGPALRGYARMLTKSGGRLVALFSLSGLAAGVLAGSAYVVMLALPAAPWTLNAADSYAHYLTLPIGLFLLAALVELGEQALPEATLIPIVREEAALTV
jgi:hypothetical protein